MYFFVHFYTLKKIHENPQSGYNDYYFQNVQKDDKNIHVKFQTQIKLLCTT